MGKGSRNRDQRRRQAWPGLDGRNPLTLGADRLEELVPVAFDHIMEAGTSEGRLSLAACWAMGVLAVNELDDDADAPWADDPTPVGLALVGAAGAAPPAGLSVEDLDTTADAWFSRLDAAGANDRIRAFGDAWDRLVRHDNPHGHPLHLAFALSLADEPLALEPLADRLLPAMLLADDSVAESEGAYLPGRTRRVPGSRAARVQLSDETADLLGPSLTDLAGQADAAGLPADATLGEVLEAQGVDVDSEESLVEMADAMAHVSPAFAHAFLATDGLILTEMNQHLVSEADAQRWSEAAGSYEVIFDRLDELERLARDDVTDEDAVMDATYDAAGTLLDELVALVDDGAITAYDRLLTQVGAHPQGSGIREQVCSSAFTDLTAEVSEDSFDGPRGEDVRRLAAVRFADRDPAMPSAVDRALAVAGTLVDGDLALSKAVDDADRELAVWVVLVAVWRASV